MRVYVSSRDIKEGIKTVTSNTRCPVARAIKRAIGKRSVLVGVSWYIVGKRYTLKNERPLPPNAVEFINKMTASMFDELEPFYFSIKVAG